MDFIKVNQDIEFKNKIFGKGTLYQGQTYFAYSQFVRETIDSGICEEVIEEKPVCPVIDPPHLKRFGTDFKNILILFAGGFGDAVMAAMVLPAIENKYKVRFDICCSSEKWLKIFSPMGMKGLRVPYPPSVDDLIIYDGIITDITKFYPKKDMTISPVLQLCRGFALEPAELPGTGFQISNNLKESLRLPDTSSPRIGVNFDSNGAVKSYPPSIMKGLLEELKSAEFELSIFGFRPSTLTPFPSHLAYDFRNKTTILELAALINQMDLIIGVDSFICHMANVLDIPTLVLLSTTPPDFFSYHENIKCITSKITCAPCFQVFDKCPTGHRECQAFYHESINHKVITKKTLEYSKEFPKKYFNREYIFSNLEPKRTNNEQR